MIQLQRWIMIFWSQLGGRDFVGIFVLKNIYIYGFSSWAWYTRLYHWWRQAQRSPGHHQKVERETLSLVFLKFSEILIFTIFRMQVVGWMRRPDKLPKTHWQGTGMALALMSEKSKFAATLSFFWHHASHSHSVAVNYRLLLLGFWWRKFVLNIYKCEILIIHDKVQVSRWRNIYMRCSKYPDFGLWRTQTLCENFKVSK